MSKKKWPVNVNLIWLYPRQSFSPHRFPHTFALQSTAASFLPGDYTVLPRVGPNQASAVGPN